jgi:hypothetical protein
VGFCMSWGGPTVVRDKLGKFPVAVVVKSKPG